MAGERKLQALLQWSVKKGSLDKTVKALLPLKTELGEIDRLVNQISKSMMALGTGKVRTLTSEMDQLKQTLKGVETTAERVASTVAKVSTKKKGSASQAESVKLETPTVSGDLSKTAGIAEIIANKTEEVKNELKQAAVEGNKTAAAVENIAQATAHAVAETQKLVGEQKKFGTNRANYTKATDFDKAVKELPSLTDAQKAQINKIYANDPGTSSSRYQFVDFDKRVNEVAQVLDDVQRKQLKIFELTDKTAQAQTRVNEAASGSGSQAAEVAKSTGKIAEEAAKAAYHFEKIGAGGKLNTKSGAKAGEEAFSIDELGTEARDTLLSQLSEEEAAALGYRKVMDGIASSTTEASEAQNMLEDEIKQVAEKAKRGKLSLEEYLALINKIATGGKSIVDAAKIADQAGIAPPTAASRKFLGYQTETGDEGEDRLKVEYAIERALDKQAASLQDQLSEEEKIWAVIKRIASTLSLTTRESAQLLSNYKGVSKETQKIAAKIGENPATVTQAKNARLASEAAKFAADGTRQNASEQERLANVVNAVGKALKMTTVEAARYVAKMKEGGGKSADELEKITRKANEAKKAIGGMAGMQFGIAGFTTTMIGSQIEQFVKPFFQLPQKFAEYAGTSNTNAREWLQTMGQVEQAQMRIAQTVAKAILPAMEKFADWVTEAAAWAEDNPEWIKALTDGATILLGAAIALKAAGFALSAIGTAQNLTGLITSQLAKAGVGTAIGAGASTAILPTILALLPAVLLAGLAYFGLSKLSLSKLGVEGHDPNKSILEEGTKAGAQLTTLAAGGLTGLFSLMTGGTLEEARAAMTRTIMGIGELTGAVDDLGSASEQAAQKTDADKIIPPDNIVKGIASLLEQLVKLETQYEEERNKLIEDAGKERVDLEKEYEQQRKELIEDFNARLAELYAGYLDQVQDATENYAKTERRAEEDYYRRRMLAAQEFGKEMERLEQDHQDRLEKMRRDHLFNVEMLVASRDALGLAREMRRYEEERAQEEANHEKEARRRNEDFADRIKQMEEEFAIERARRREDFEDRLREIEEDYQRQKAKLAQQQADRLAELARQQEEENKMFGENLEEQLKLLDERYAKEREQMEKQIADQILLAESLGLTAQNIQLIYDTAVEYFSRLQTLRNQVLSSLNYRGYGGGLPGTGVPGAAGYGEGRSAGTKSTTIGFATGGYSYKSGLYALSEDNTREFVLSNPTVKALEKAGGHLTQDKVLAMTHRGVSPSGGEVTVRVDQNNWRIEGALTVAEKRALMKEVHEATYQAVKGVNRR